jgi:hypothetical protein
MGPKRKLKLQDNTQWGGKRHLLQHEGQTELLRQRGWKKPSIPLHENLNLPVVSVESSDAKGRYVIAKEAIEGDRLLMRYIGVVTDTDPQNAHTFQVKVNGKEVFIDGALWSKWGR